MRLLILLAAVLVSLTLTQPATAQDFVGFDRESFGSVVLNRKQAAGGGNDISLELAVGSYNNESITNYSRESIFAKMGLSVGRLDILTDKGVFPCTAFIVDEKHILTNHHCVPGILDNERAAATRIDSVMFVTGYVQQGVEEGTKRYTVIPTPVEANKDLDFAVLEVIGNPAAEFGALRLAANLPHDGDPYWVIGHPMGEAQRISREKCRANRPAVSNQRLLHTCDTLPGNSGSPVIDASTQMVIGLHHAGSNRDAVNFAIPMGDIIAASRVLKASTEAPGPAPNPGPNPGPDPDASYDQGQPPRADICDALYEEAKSYGQCFAYEAYLQACESHPYAILARGYVTRECTEAPVPPTTPEPPTTRLLRPWCGASSLNATERAICADTYLADLDARLEQAYKAPARPVSSAQQGAWRTGSRDACGGNSGCIASEVEKRITYLLTPAPVSQPPAGGVVPGNYTLTSSCYIITASRPTISEAKGFIAQWFGSGQGVRMFKSTNGFYGIALETISRSRADARLSQLKSAGQVPSDSYCSTGSRFTAEILWNGSGSGGGSGSGYTMYIDNTSSLNVRTGPAKDYPRITALDRGTKVTVLRDSNGWSNIRMPNGSQGWVSASYLSRSKPSPQRQCYATVVNLNSYNSRTRADGTGYLNIRSAPSTRGNIVSETYRGDTMLVLAQRSGWAQVRCVSGQCRSPYRGSGSATGWASSKFLSIRCN